MTMDVRCAVVIAFDRDEAIGVKLRLLPLAPFVLGRGQRLERRLLDRFEAFAARDAKATMPLAIDPLEAYHERSSDLGAGGKSSAPKADAKVATQDLYHTLDDRLILG